MSNRYCRAVAAVLLVGCSREENASLDSTAAQSSPVAAVEDTAVRRARPDLERAFASFDPATLKVADAPVRLDGTCGSEGGAAKGLVPATIRLLGLEPHNPGVLTRLEIVSVADVTPADGDDVCTADSVRFTARVDTTELQLALFWNPLDGTDPADRAEWYTDATAWIPDANRTSVALFAAADATPGMQLAPGVTMAQLRARIDSIRAARLP